MPVPTPHGWWSSRFPSPRRTCSPPHAGPHHAWGRQRNQTALPTLGRCRTFAVRLATVLPACDTSPAPWSPGLAAGAGAGAGAGVGAEGSLPQCTPSSFSRVASFPARWHPLAPVAPHQLKCTHPTVRVHRCWHPSSESSAVRPCPGTPSMRGSLPLGSPAGSHLQSFSARPCSWALERGRVRFMAMMRSLIGFGARASHPWGRISTA